MELEGNFEQENVKSVVSSITFDSKVEMLISYYKKNKIFPCLDLISGDYHEYINNKKVNKGEYFTNSAIGSISGIFSAKRIYPPAKSSISLGNDVRMFSMNREFSLSGIEKCYIENIFTDFVEKQETLWGLYTTKANSVKGEIDILIGNIRTVSQSGLVKLYKETEYSIGAVGILNWDNDTLMCDPIAFRLL